MKKIGKRLILYLSTPNNASFQHYLHSAGEKGLLVQDTLIVLHQVIELICQLQRERLQ